MSRERFGIHGTCWHCDTGIARRNARAWWAVNNDVDRTVTVHRACWAQLRSRALGVTVKEYNTREDATIAAWAAVGK